MKTVIITIEGGTIQDVSAPEGIQVLVKDYDVDDDQHPEVQFDELGDPYWLTIFQNGTPLTDSEVNRLGLP